MAGSSSPPSQGPAPLLRRVIDSRARLIGRALLARKQRQRRVEWQVLHEQL